MTATCSLAAVISMTAIGRAVLAPVTLAELVEMTDYVVRGKVLSQRSDWSADSTQILTTVTIQTSAVYRGRVREGERISIICPGGIVDGLAMEVEHSPAFQPHEDVILFLTMIDNSACRVSGWEAGKFTIRRGRIVENGMLLSQFKKQLDDAIKTVGTK